MRCFNAGAGLYGGFPELDRRDAPSQRCSRKGFEAARRLLEAGAPPNSPQAGGWFAVLSAARHGDMRLMRLLVDFCADLTIRNAAGRTAAEIAAAAGNRELAETIAGGCRHEAARRQGELR